MSFSDVFREASCLDHPVVAKFDSLMDLKSDAELEAMAQEAQRLTRMHFGKTMRLFAPLYLSNECVNVCKYCGFSRDNPILRTTLTPEQVEAEARHLVEGGFRNILLVAGEHPKFVSDNYLETCIRRLKEWVPSVSLEVGPLETEPYRQMVKAGAEGLVVYQETYHRETYAKLHTAGPKKDFDWRLDCPERAAEAGFKRIGIGALLGLAPWKDEARALVAHAAHLLKHCWRSYLTISLPRLRPAAGEFEPGYPIPDREFVQLICALRIVFPQVGLVLSTREAPAFRDNILPLGITMMSAGAKTDPGGYTGVGREELHRTEKGLRKAIEKTEIIERTATEQFAIADERSAAQVAERLRVLGFEPVWKDWETCLSGSA